MLLYVNNELCHKKCFYKLRNSKHYGSIDRHFPLLSSIMISSKTPTTSEPIVVIQRFIHRLSLWHAYINKPHYHPHHYSPKPSTRIIHSKSIFVSPQPRNITPGYKVITACLVSLKFNGDFILHANG